MHPSHHAVAAVPYWRLSSFYLFYFASLGALIPYFGLYLQALGFSAREIGELMATLMITRLVAPNVWAWLADHRGQRMAIVRLASLLAALCFAGIFWGQGYWWLVLVMSLFSFFWNASLPQFEATTLSYLGKHSHHYSRIRVWGSVGFILSVWGLGIWLETQPVIWIPITVLGLFGAIWINSLLVPERRGGHSQHTTGSLLSVLRRPLVLALLGACFLMQASHGPYYTFYTLYLSSVGYSQGLIGGLWALGVAAEVAVFLVMHRLLLRFGLRRLLLASFALAALRWLMIGWGVQQGWVLVLAQLLHAASFGIYHATVIQLIHRYFTGRHQGRGQALYSSVSFGAGGALGTVLSGYSWEYSPALTYSGAAGACLLGGLIVWRWLRDLDAPDA